MSKGNGKNKKMVEQQTPLDLPEFEGIRPVGVVTSFKGASQRIQRPIHHRERGVALVEWQAVDIGFPEDKQGVKRKQVLAVLDIYEIAGEAGAGLLRYFRQQYRVAEDTRLGREPLFDDSAVPAGIQTDESGIVMTPTEVLEAAGIDPAAVPRAVVLVFDDGARGVWPDEWEGSGQTLVPAGGFMRRPGSTELGDVAQVREVLDVGSGETLDSWTDEQEDARLASLESEAAVAEAREDREAAEQLEAGRHVHIVDAGVDPFDTFIGRSARDMVTYVRRQTDRDHVLAVASWEEARDNRKSVVDAATKRAAELLG